MSDTARARIVTLIKGIAPTAEPGVRFTLHDAGLIESAVRKTRAFRLSDGTPRDYGLVGSTPAVWVDEFDVEVRYEAGAKPREAVARMAARDYRDIVRTLCPPSAWSGYMRQLRAGHEPPTYQDIAGTDGNPVAMLMSVPVQIHYSES